MLHHSKMCGFLERSNSDTNINRHGQAKYIHKNISFLDGATQDCLGREVIEVMETQVECSALLSAWCHQPPSICCINRFFSVP